MAVAIILVLLTSVRWCSTSSARGGGRRSPRTGATSTTRIIITFWITGVVFVAVVLFMAYCVFRFRHREGSQAHYEPENKRLEMVADGRHRRRRRGHAGAGPLRLEPVRHRPAGRHRGRGRRPAMAVELPAARQGRPARHLRHARLSAPTTRSASTRTIPTGRTTSSIEADDLHLPIGKPVKVLLRSIDVLHDFYVPEFRAKMDMIPGTVTYFWFTPTRTGTFEVLCAELCGVGHPHDARHGRGRRRSATTRPGCDSQQTFAPAVAAATTGRTAEPCD